MKKVSLLLICLLLILLGGCNFSKENKERQLTIAEVNGERVLKGEMIDVYNRVKPYYGVSEEVEHDPKQSYMVNYVKNLVIEQLIYEKIILQKARDAGLRITEEIIKDAQKEFDNIVADTAAEIKSTKFSFADQEEDFTSEALEHIQGKLTEEGISKDEYIQNIAKDIVVGNFMEIILKNIEASEYDTREYYDEQLKLQKESPEVLEDLEIESFEVELIKPKEVRVKHVFMAIPHEVTEQYENLLAQGKEQEAENLLNYELKSIEPKARKVLKMAHQGEDFEKLISEYGEDPQMDSNEEGYLVRNDGHSISIFQEAAFKLKVGQISNLVKTSYGYHIIKVYEIIPEKTYSFEEKREVLKLIVDEHKKMEEWQRLVNQWEETADIKKYEELY